MIAQPCKVSIAKILVATRENVIGFLAFSETLIKNNGAEPISMNIIK